jgi:hypothetical protein
MKKRPSLTVCLCACILVSSWYTATAQEKPKAHPSRTWTSVNGNTIEGAFVKEDGGKIYIQRPDGSMIGTTRDKLSPLDLAWIDGASAPSNTTKTLSFTLATQLEKNKMEVHRLVRRLIIKTYSQLTNNDRDDKMLFFLQRDALSMYGWTAVSADCYLTKSGKKGKIKEMTFIPQGQVELREAVQMVRDKLTLTMPDPVVVKEISEDGEKYWEVQNPPDYVSRVLLLVDEETKKIKRFDIKFPPPPEK